MRIISVKRMVWIDHYLNKNCEDSGNSTNGERKSQDKVVKEDRNMVDIEGSEDRIELIIHRRLSWQRLNQQFLLIQDHVRNLFL